MYDPTERPRRERMVEIAADAGSREALEARHGQVWDTAELTRDFTVSGFAAPLVVVRRKADGVKGSLEFQPSPTALLQLRGASPEMTPKFHPGQVVATPGALDALVESGQDAAFFLDMHLYGNWGEVDAEDQAANDQALLDGGRLLSSYRTLKGAVIWVLTEAVGDVGRRASTCLTTPSEY